MIEWGILKPLLHRKWEMLMNNLLKSVTTTTVLTLYKVLYANECVHSCGCPATCAHEGGLTSASGVNSALCFDSWFLIGLGFPRTCLSCLPNCGIANTRHHTWRFRTWILGSNWDSQALYCACCVMKRDYSVHGCELSMTFNALELGTDLKSNH